METRITLIKEDGRNKHNHKMCIAKCFCGKEFRLRKQDFTSGNTTSCGCQRKHKDRKLVMLKNQYANLKCRHKNINTRENKNSEIITFEKFRDISFANCRYCGQTPNRIIKDKYTTETINIIGVDRISSTDSYTDNNVEPCCELCNKMKLQLTTEEFEQHISKIYLHLKTHIDYA